MPAPGTAATPEDDTQLVTAQNSVAKLAAARGKCLPISKRGGGTEGRREGAGGVDSTISSHSVLTQTPKTVVPQTRALREETLLNFDAIRFPEES